MAVFQNQWIPLLRSVISSDSSVGRGTREVVGCFERMSKDFGLARWAPKPGLQSNIYITVADFEKFDLSELGKLKPFFFLSHLDTGAPKFADLENPFDLQVEGTMLKGLGLASGKVDFLAKLLALNQIQSELALGQKWRKPPFLVGTYAGLQSMRGALEFARLFKPEPSRRSNNEAFALNDQDKPIVLVGAPTHLKLAERTKGLMKLEAKIPFEEDERSWRRQHSAASLPSLQSVAESRLFRGDLDKSAIAEALEFVSQLPSAVGLLQFDSGDPYSFEARECFLEMDLADSLKFPMVKKLSRLFRVLQKIESYLKTQVDFNFEPPYPTLTLTQVSCTETHLSIQCVVESIHPLRRSASDQKDYALKAFEEIRQELQALSGSVDLLRSFQPTGPFFEPESGSDQLESENEKRDTLKENFKAALSASGLSLEIGAHSQCGESSVLEAMGFRCLSFGPGTAYNPYLSTGEAESMAQAEFSKAVDFYQEVMRRFCL